MTFNLKDDLKSIQVERVTKLSLVLDLKPHEFQEIQEKTLTNGLKLIGSTAYNLKEIYIKFVSCFDTEKTKEDFQKSFRQMSEHLTKSLQKLYNLLVSRKTEVDTHEGHYKRKHRDGVDLPSVILTDMIRPMNNIMV